jgi:hypothetical protein
VQTMVNILGDLIRVAWSTVAEPGDPYNVDEQVSVQHAVLVDQLLFRRREYRQEGFSRGEHCDGTNHAADRWGGGSSQGNTVGGVNGDAAGGGGGGGDGEVGGEEQAAAMPKPAPKPGGGGGGQMPPIDMRKLKKAVAPILVKAPGQVRS